MDEVSAQLFTQQFSGVAAMRLLVSAMVGALVEKTAEDRQAIGEFAREVRAAVVARQGEIGRAASASGRELLREGRSLAFDIADLADAARRARADRLRKDQRRSAGRKW
ncbi:hypothetical protein [Nocardia rhizosphaerihabitans]|uniref:hypothetical protein n=1 Tax=Nocardia rhizosphaerihabitans TaxID=1691570 RepID=UPI001662A374|nr:hypothetical protein [Nocardia rhizosphaerihabitans]